MAASIFSISFSARTLMAHSRQTSGPSERFLDRRTLLKEISQAGSGLALIALLAEDGLLHGSSEKPHNRETAIEDVAPHTPRFPARAKRILHVFCTGAV